MRLLLLNPNPVKPPLPPIGLEYLYDNLLAAGHEIKFHDAAWEEPQGWLEYLTENRPAAVGITVRNIDDCLMFSQSEFIPLITDLVGMIRRRSDAKVILGGAGFAMMPEEILRATGADLGVTGDGEFVICELLSNLETPERVPNVCFRESGSDRIITTPRQFFAIDKLPAPSRRLVDHAAYARGGGICNVQTGRGCNQRCIYCPEPRIMGRALRHRSPESVVEELTHLGAPALQKVFFVDSEFNLDYRHAVQVCEAIIRSGVQVRWTCTLMANNADKKLIGILKRAGCRTIVWSVDAASEKMLDALGKSIAPGDIERVSRWCDELSLPYAHALLLGGPGETCDTIDETCQNIARTKAFRIDVMTGIRVYPNTDLYETARAEGLIPPGWNPLAPLYFREEHVRRTLHPHVVKRFSQLPNAQVSGLRRSVELRQDPVDQLGQRGAAEELRHR